MESLKNVSVLVPSDAGGNADVPSLFRERLTCSMEERSLSCSALARRSDLPEKTLRNILQGVASDPRLSTFYRIAVALGGDANKLLGLSPPPPSGDCGTTVCKVSMIGDLRRRLGQRDDEISRLQADLVEKSAGLSQQRECCASWQRDAQRLQADLTASRSQIRRLRVVAFVSGALFVCALLLAVYVLWDALHPGQGFFR